MTWKDNMNLICLHLKTPFVSIYGPGLILEKNKKNKKKTKNKKQQQQQKKRLKAPAVGIEH